MKYKTLIKKERLYQQKFPQKYREFIAGNFFWSEQLLPKGVEDQLYKVPSLSKKSLVKNEGDAENEEIKFHEKEKNAKEDIAEIKKISDLSTIDQCRQCHIFCQQSLKGGVREIISGKIKVLFMFDRVGVMKEDGITHYSKNEVVTENKRQIVLKMAQALGFERQDFALSSLVKCPEIEDSFWENSVTQCLSWVEKELLWCRPEIIVAFGARVSKQLLGKEEKISQIHGKFFSLHHDLFSSTHLLKKSCSSIKVLPTFHLDYIMINDMMKKLAWEDLKKIPPLLKRSSVETKNELF
jgi:uracil-DNA glycosylase family 4